MLSLLSLLLYQKQTHTQIIVIILLKERREKKREKNANLVDIARSVQFMCVLWLCLCVFVCARNIVNSTL